MVTISSQSCSSVRRRPVFAVLPTDFVSPLTHLANVRGDAMDKAVDQLLAEMGEKTEPAEKVDRGEKVEMAEKVDKVEKSATLVK